MTKPQVWEKAETFLQFRPDYLRDHAQAGTRVLHFIGTGLGVAALILGIVMLDPMIAILGILLGYVFAWTGHFLIERNRPSMTCPSRLVVPMRCARVAALAWQAAQRGARGRK